LVNFVRAPLAKRLGMWALCVSKARERSAAEGGPRRPLAARGYPRFVPPCFEAVQGLFTY